MLDVAAAVKAAQAAQTAPPPSTGTSSGTATVPRVRRPLRPVPVVTTS
jgi:hypothetical protein